LKLRKKLDELGGEYGQAHPRMVMKILSEGSWTEDEKLKSFWSGLLASSCTGDGKDDSNVIFLNILSQITSLQARVIEYSCSNASVRVSEQKLLYAEIQEMTIEELMKIVESDDIHRIDLEMDHLSNIGLTGGIDVTRGGIGLNTGVADITPPTLALQMYARCNGYIGPFENFYDIKKDGISDE